MLKFEVETLYFSVIPFSILGKLGLKNEDEKSYNKLEQKHHFYQSIFLYFYSSLQINANLIPLSDQTVQIKE